MSARIAIVTPTVTHRRQWVELQHRYYAGCDVDRVYALDDTHNAFDAIREVLPTIDAEYLVFAGDDDFHVPTMLHNLADWLDKSGAEIVGVYGDGLLVQCDDWKIGWTVDYSTGMKIERAYSVTRAEVFKNAIKQVPRSKERSLEVMNRQNRHFIQAMEAQGEFHHTPGLQLIHCNHPEHRRNIDPAWRTWLEGYGGGWFASWFPSRVCSRRNLERKRSPHHREFMRFKNVVDTFRVEDAWRQGRYTHIEHHPL